MAEVVVVQWGEVAVGGGPWGEAHRVERRGRRRLLLVKEREVLELELVDPHPELAALAVVGVGQLVERVGPAHRPHGRLLALGPRPLGDLLTHRAPPPLGLACLLPKVGLLALPKVGLLALPGLGGAREVTAGGGGLLGRQLLVTPRFEPAAHHGDVRPTVVEQPVGRHL